MHPMPNLSEGILWYLAFLFSVVVHEASHAYAALKLGDKTAYEGGQVSLDPFPHIKREPFGTVVVPILSFLLGGWMIGWASAPYDPVWARNYPKRSAMMALAGPLANLAILVAVGLLIHIGIFFDLFYPPERIHLSQVVLSHADGMMVGVAVFMSILFSLNLLLFSFNLIPLPPLDGSGIIPIFLSDDHTEKYLDFLHNSSFSFIGIFIAWKVFDLIDGPIHFMAITLLYPGLGYH